MLDAFAVDATRTPSGRGTVAAVFFVASQVAQEFLTDSYGWMAGGVTAGLLVFALAPLQRLGDRVAAAALPSAREGVLSPERRALFYRRAVAMALSDGAISREEERHLAHLAEEVGLGPLEALRVREDVERELGAAA